MVVDALIAADPILKLSEKIDNPDQYLYLTDSVLEEIERSTHPVSMDVDKLNRMQGSYKQRRIFFCVGPGHSSRDHRPPPTTRSLPHRGLQSRSVSLPGRMGKHLDGRQHCQGGPSYDIFWALVGQ